MPISVSSCPFDSLKSSGLITTIFPHIYARTYYAHPRARGMSFSDWLLTWVQTNYFRVERQSCENEPHCCLRTKKQYARDSTSGGLAMKRECRADWFVMNPCVLLLAHLLHSWLTRIVGRIYRWRLCGGRLTAGLLFTAAAHSRKLALTACT